MSETKWVEKPYDRVYRSPPPGFWEGIRFIPVFLLCGMAMPFWLFYDLITDKPKEAVAGSRASLFFLAAVGLFYPFGVIYAIGIWFGAW